MGALTYPKLRWPIDVRIEEYDGQSALVLRCPVGISPPLALSPAIAPVLSILEGNISREDILARFSQRGLTAGLLDELLELLEKNLFLATPRYFAEERIFKESFTKASVRQPALAGGAYALDSAELGREIDGYLSSGTTEPTDCELVGVMAPHIDYRRGHLCYGLTYARLTNRTEDVYILIGTSHQYSKQLFHLTAKDFASPLGTVVCDVDFVSRLAGRFGTERSFADEFLHKNEHSLELQIPFIARLNPRAKIVPILVGGFHRMIAADRLPHETAEYDDFVAALAECVRSNKEDGRKVCVLAGVDMAHVGNAFGDEGRLTPERMLFVAARDREYLDALEKQDKRELFGHIASDGDARRVCGFPTMYTVLDLYDRLGIKYRSELIDYRQAVDYRTDCAVTFAGMTLTQ